MRSRLRSQYPLDTTQSELIHLYTNNSCQNCDLSSKLCRMWYTHPLCFKRQFQNNFKKKELIVCIFDIIQIYSELELQALKCTVNASHPILPPYVVHINNKRGSQQKTKLLLGSQIEVIPRYSSDAITEPCPRIELRTLLCNLKSAPSPLRPYNP